MHHPTRGSLSEPFSRVPGGRLPGVWCGRLHMTSLHDHAPGGDLVFAGDLDGVQFRLLDLQMYNNDDEEKPDVPANDTVHGNWLKVETEQHEECFISAPGELIEGLQDYYAEQGDLFEVTRCAKSGSAQTDPYEVNLEDLEDDQSRL